MGAQSLVIGKMFGEGFQYGKRKISAMTNEEFNKLTFEDMMSNARIELRNSIPTMNAALQDMKPMVDIVVREFLQYINEVSKTLQAVTVTGLEQGAHALGTHVPGAHPDASLPAVTPLPPGPSIQQPFSPSHPTPFTPTEPKKGVTQTNVSIFGLPKAGQTQKLERNKIIQQIAKLGLQVSKPNKGIKNWQFKLQFAKAELKRRQDALKKLLAAYNWL